jgi:excisionase family DNA binding protein
MDAHDPRGSVSAPLLDVDALARRLGVTVRFVRRLVEERRIPYMRVGRFVRFDPAEIERWLAATRVEVQPVRWRRH